MKVQINAGSAYSEAVAERIEEEVVNALKVHADRVTRVEVHLHDVNGRKGGCDKQCVVEVRLAGRPPLAVEHEAHDMYDAISGAAQKAGRAVRHRLERDNEHRASA